MEKLLVGSFVFLLLLPRMLMQSGAGPGQLCMGGPTFQCLSYLVCEDDNHCKKKASFPCSPVGGDYCLKNGQCKTNGVCPACVCNDGYTKSSDSTMCVPNTTPQMTQTTTPAMTTPPPPAMTTPPPPETTQTTPPETTQAPEDGGCTVVVSLTLLTASLLATGFL